MYLKFIFNDLGFKSLQFYFIFKFERNYKLRLKETID